MTISAKTTVRELAVEVPGATRVFEKLGIDYCCGGGKALEEACAKPTPGRRSIVAPISVEASIVSVPPASQIVRCAAFESATIEYVSSPAWYVMFAP